MTETTTRHEQAATIRFAEIEVARDAWAVNKAVTHGQQHSSPALRVLSRAIRSQLASEGKEIQDDEIQRVLNLLRRSGKFPSGEQLLDLMRKAPTIAAKSPGGNLDLVIDSLVAAVL
jgi:hypothetical protein